MGEALVDNVQNRQIPERWLLELTARDPTQRSRSHMCTPDVHSRELCFVLVLSVLAMVFPAKNG